MAPSSPCCLPQPTDGGGCKLSVPWACSQAVKLVGPEKERAWQGSLAQGPQWGVCLCGFLSLETQSPHMQEPCAFCLGPLGRAQPQAGHTACAWGSGTSPTVGGRR